MSFLSKIQSHYDVESDTRGCHRGRIPQSHIHHLSIEDMNVLQKRRDKRKLAHKLSLEILRDVENNLYMSPKYVKLVKELADIAESLKDPSLRYYAKGPNTDNIPPYKVYERVKDFWKSADFYCYKNKSNDNEGGGNG